MKKHSTQTGLPVIVDFYSDGCGPCRMIAPVFKKLAKEIGNKAGEFLLLPINPARGMSFANVDTLL